MVHNPCKECNRRNIACHVECDDYKRYATLRALEKQAADNEMLAERALAELRKKRRRGKVSQMQHRLRAEGGGKK